MKSPALSAVIFGIPLLTPLAGCISARVPTDPPSGPAAYADPARWLCLPGRDDACAARRTIVESAGNGTVRPVADPPAAADPGIDCFYIYPTVTMSPIPRNADNFRRNHQKIMAVAQVQAASFRTACRVFAPYYRQSTIATYILPERVRQTYVKVALADVEAAFDRYMAEDNGGRRIVLIGHSQGAELVTRLMQDRFDSSSAMRARLALAIVAGAPVHVPAGNIVGGTFANIPTCTRPGETGCYVTYKSFIEGTHPESEKRMVAPAGMEEACVNPATLDVPTLSPAARRDGRKVLSGTLLPPPAWSLGGVKGDKETRAFDLVRRGYSAACAFEPEARLRYLSIREELAPDDPRRASVPFSSGKLRKGLGLHVLDLQFPQTALVALVKARQPSK